METGLLSVCLSVHPFVCMMAYPALLQGARKLEKDDNVACFVEERKCLFCEFTKRTQQKGMFPRFRVWAHGRLKK